MGLGEGGFSCTTCDTEVAEGLPLGCITMDPTFFSGGKRDTKSEAQIARDRNLYAQEKRKFLSGTAVPPPKKAIVKKSSGDTSSKQLHGVQDRLQRMFESNRKYEEAEMSMYHHCEKSEQVTKVRLTPWFALTY